LKSSRAPPRRTFVDLVSQTSAKQIIYLGGITNEDKLSTHLASRKKVDEVLRSGPVPVTSLKAAIIVGSGSSSFEIIRDLVEKLPIMIAPRWLDTRTQPIAIRNVLEYLTGVLLRPDTYGGSYDIGGPDVMTYKEMLQQYAEVRGLKRRIYHRACDDAEAFVLLALLRHEHFLPASRQSGEQHEDRGRRKAERSRQKARHQAVDLQEKPSGWRFKRSSRTALHQAGRIRSFRASGTVRCESIWRCR
jgi:uncharacterized protein YbjT (DUF2867 family)